MSNDRIILERRFIPKGSVFIKQGDDAYSAYLIQSGRVSVYSYKNGKTHELAQLGVGQICGEMALMNEATRTASVRAIEDCNLIVITKTAFEEKLKNSDPTIRAIVEMLIDRVHDLNNKILDDESPQK